MLGALKSNEVGLFVNLRPQREVGRPSAAGGKLFAMAYEIISMISFAGDGGRSSL